VTGYERAEVNRLAADRLAHAAHPLSQARRADHRPDDGGRVMTTQSRINRTVGMCASGGGYSHLGS
jgi:hypothetical protein